MNMIFRRMTIEDVPAAYEIDVLSFSLPWSERSIRFEVSDNPAARCWVADINGRLVGVLILWMIVDESHIATLATHPDFRQQGIAKMLLVDSLNCAYQDGAKSAYLEVRAGNKLAIKIYEDFGFEIVGSRDGYYKDNNEDAVLMTLNQLPVRLPIIKIPLEEI